MSFTIPLALKCWLLSIFLKNWSEYNIFIASFILLWKYIRNGATLVSLFLFRLNICNSFKCAVTFVISSTVILKGQSPESLLGIPFSFSKSCFLMICSKLQRLLYVLLVRRRMEQWRALKSPNEVLLFMKIMKTQTLYMHQFKSWWPSRMACNTGKLQLGEIRH